MPKLTVISLMDGAPWGGSEELWCDLANEAIQKGFEVQLSVPDWGDLPPKIEALKNKGACINRRFMWRPGESLTKKAIRKTLEILNRNRNKHFYEIERFAPDYVLVSQGGTFDFCSHPDLHKLINVIKAPFALLCHSLAEYQFQDDETRRCAIEWFSRAKFVGFVAERSRVMAEHKLAHKLCNAVIVRNPVNLLDLNVVRYPKPSECVKLACVGELNVAWKGQDLLIELLGRKRWRNRKWELSLYGKGRDELYLAGLADYYAIADRVKFCGYAQNIKEVWEKNEILVMPSRVESAPLALVEAMICGRPSVVTPVGGIPEWVKDSETGYLAACTSVDALDEALDRAWLQKSQWGEIGERAHELTKCRVPHRPGLDVLDMLID